MKTDARLALMRRQRRFEWALARDEQARTAASLVAGRTHDLLNLLQIIRLSSRVLEQRCDAAARELVEDLQRTADDSHRSLSALLAAARATAAPTAAPEPRGAPVAAVVEATVASLRDAFAAHAGAEARIEARIEAPPAATTRCTAEELEHLVIGLALDAADVADGDQPVPAPTLSLSVRERAIDGAPWVELVRSSDTAPTGERFELRVVDAIARRAGGELTTSERKGGGEEVIVALPEVA